MSDTIITVENLSKKYIIGHQRQERYTALRDVITNKVKSISSFRNPQAKVKNTEFEEFWALKDVSFDIKQGDRVGIIGANGAGKSTLLKILSRITEPTSGSIKIKGRVASLLEVGTGFHPELTGRENIFLNGAILGMGKEEIKRKFDEIVAFAEVEKFLDTPVKRYSSGMYVRLAFAVAAHLEPEILIVDEVLAVGDMKFQEKCLGKMQDLSKTGRTLIFVSHNMSAIENLCSRGICLRQGNVSCTGLIDDVIADYLAYQQNNQNLDLLTNSHKRKGSGELRVIKVSIDNEEDLQNTIKIGESLNIVLTLKKSGSIYQPSIMMTIYDHMGGYIAHLNTEISGYRVNAENDITKVVCHIPCLNLVPKSYRINIAIMKDNSFIDHVVDAYSFSILEKDIFGTGKIPKSGILVIEPVWSMV